MSNHHLRNRGLDLESKGIDIRIALPEDWDYTLAGLSHINRESIDAIRTAVWELEKAGYILRRQGRDEKGKMTAIEYTIYEQPQPMLENPIPGKPMLENPTADNPTSENPTQLNKDRSRTNLSKKEKSITDLSSTDSFPILSPDPSPCRAAPERKGTEVFKQSAVDIYREIIMENIEYDTLTQDPKWTRSVGRDCRPYAGNCLLCAKDAPHRWRRLPRRAGKEQILEAEQQPHRVCHGLYAGEHHEDPQHQAISAGGAVQRSVHHRQLLYRPCRTRHGKS